MKKAVIFCFLILLLLVTSCNGTTGTGTITSEVDDEATVKITDTTTDTPNTPSTEPDETDVPDTEPDPDTPATTWFFPQLKEPSQEVMTALLSGILELTDGYLKVHDYIIVWQPEYTVDDSNGTLEILDGEGTVVGRVGELIRMGGGEAPPNNALLKERLPAGTTGPFWLQGGSVQLYIEPEVAETLPPDQSAAETTENQSSNALDFVQTDNVTSIEQSTVKVENFSYGVVVGDGSYVLTALRYEQASIQDVVTVTTSTGATFSGTIEAMDPRTGATLVHVNGMSLPPCSIRDSSEVQPDQYMYVQGWAGQIFKYTSVQVIRLGSWGLEFSVHMRENTSELPFSYVNSCGAPVTDRNGNVVGLIVSHYYPMALTSGFPGMMGPCVLINSAMELLEPGAATRPFSQGPVAISKMSADKAMTTSGIFNLLGSMADYETLTTLSLGYINQFGDRLDSEPDAQTFVTAQSYRPSMTDDSICLILVFPQTHIMRTTAGQSVGTAKWIAIHWNRNEGKPDRIFFGTELFVTQGIYTLEGDTSGLEALLR